MFVSARIEVEGRRVLIVEAETELAADMAAWVRINGGEVVGELASPEAAITALDHRPDFDAVMVDVETANGLAPLLVDTFEQRHVDVIWIIGHDGWFFDPNEEAYAYRLAGDPDNVVRVRWPRT